MFKSSDFHSSKLDFLKELIRSGKDINISDLSWNSPKALIASLAHAATQKTILLITAASQEESSLYNDFPLFTDAFIGDYPAWETLPNENVPPSPDTVGERYNLLNRLLSNERPIILCGLQALLQRVITPARLKSLSYTLKVGEEYPFSDLCEMFAQMGYRREAIASDKGEYALRGGIVDIYPVDSPDPVRIEFWEDRIEGIRRYDPIGQRSTEKIEKISLTPAKELELIVEETKLSSFFEFLPKETFVIFDDLHAISKRWEALQELGLPSDLFFDSLPLLIEQLSSFQKIYISNEKEIPPEFIGKMENSASWPSAFVPVSTYLQKNEDHILDLQGAELLHHLATVGSDQPITMLSSSEAEQKAFERKLEEESILLPPKTKKESGYLSAGFALEDGNLLLLPLTEFNRRYKIRRQKMRSTFHTAPGDNFNLSMGDLVVHHYHGIGKYLGITKRKNIHGVETEFFHIEYSSNSRLFVPLEQAGQITRYVGSSEKIPSLSTIGSPKWKRTKEKTQQEITAYAKELIELYAERSLRGGFPYPEDSSQMIAFEEDFPYTPTEDQLRAIHQIKIDMQSEKPMDRLICGDVGYGKTEVAMRAAFKAVVDGGKQVAILTPTTVLALQHYESLTERMANFPINIAVASRFQSTKEMKKTLDGLKEGKIDILIGTHRLISQDVVFKDLGLVIIDEEQRFGVKAKEHLKKIQIGVDYLTLSATPIPRTLYLSLIGARDLSVINTPPQERIPIKTFITVPNEETVRNALLRELARDGQAFVIHNRVETIYEFAAWIKELVPQARILVGHGQMDAKELDKIFHQFKSGQADILVATTIVENGIDIPNANTIIIDKADHFGVAELYQLRGRGGRWNRRAYCYFIVNNFHNLPEVTRKRLQALVQTSGYGGGLKVATADLEQRGSGDVIGIRQSGHVSAVGFYLYCRMLRETIQALQGEKSHFPIETKLDHTFDARLPEEYVNDFSLRMQLYQKIGQASNLEEVEQVYLEILDRFGAMAPEQVGWLYHLARIRVQAASFGIEEVKLTEKEMVLHKQGKIEKFGIQTFNTAKEYEEKVIKIMNLCSYSV